MNPFTESTVARPLGHNPFNRRDPHFRPENRAADHQSAQVEAAAPTAISPEPAQPVARIAPFARKQGPLAALVLAATCFMVGLLAPHHAYAIDVNQASVEQLKAVRGIGPKTAQIIIDERTRGGSYESFSDLSDRVKGIGSKKSVALQQAGLTIGGAEAPKPPKKQGR